MLWRHLRSQAARDAAESWRKRRLQSHALLRRFLKRVGLSSHSLEFKPLKESKNGSLHDFKDKLPRCGGNRYNLPSSKRSEDYFYTSFMHWEASERALSGCWATGELLDCPNCCITQHWDSLRVARWMWRCTWASPTPIPKKLMGLGLLFLQTWPKSYKYAVSPQDN